MCTQLKMYKKNVGMGWRVMSLFHNSADCITCDFVYPIKDGAVVISH